MNPTTQQWIGRLPGHSGLLRVRPPAEPGGRATFDLPGDLVFDQELHPCGPFEPKRWAKRVGEYTDGDLTIVVSMNAGTTISEPFPFYYDLDHAAAVPLFQIDDRTALSEQGEELRFLDADTLRLSIQSDSVELKRSPAPVTESIRFRVPERDAVLSGTLLLPASTVGPYPTLILAHGAAFHQRDYYRLFAHTMVRAGYAAFIYDRQGHGASTGKPDTDLHTNALGVEAAMDHLAKRADIGPIGLWGCSNGMWTVPLVAARRPDVAFVVGVGAPGVTMAEAEVHRRVGALKAGGVDAEAAAIAGRAWRLLWRLQAGEAEKGERDELQRLLADLYADETVQAFASPEYAVRNPRLSPLPPMDAASQAIAKSRRAATNGGDYDPAESYRLISCPILLQYGAEDPNLPAARSAERIREAIASPKPKAKGKPRPRAKATITVHPDAGHMLDAVPASLTGLDYEQAAYRMHGFRFAPGVVPELMSWLEETRSALH